MKKIKLAAFGYEIACNFDHVPENNEDNVDEVGDCIGGSGDSIIKILKKYEGRSDSDMCAEVMRLIANHK